MKRVFFLVAVITLIIFCACEKETVDNTSTVDSIDNLDSFVDEGKGHYTTKYRCYYIVEKGLKLSFACLQRYNGICNVYKICIPELIIDPCWIVPCWIDIFDPWEIYKEIDPARFLSFKDKLELDVDPRETAFPFALNEKIAGLQVYQEDGFFEDGIFRLKENLILDAETSKQLGLQGNVVKPGEYPVIANKENGTFNVILAVEEGFRN